MARLLSLTRLARLNLLNARWAWTPLFALTALIAISFAVRLFLFSLLPLHQDEAYNYLLTQHPALSYYDHPPMVMWVCWLGIKLCGCVVTPLTARFGFLLMMAGSMWVLGRLTSRWYGGWSGCFAALLLGVSGYHGTTGGMVLPESPLLFFSLLTIWAASVAVTTEPQRLWPWVGVGLAFGGAMLSKYFAVFLPVGVLAYVLITPSARRLLLTPGPYLAVAIGLVVFSPVLIWNATHGWVSFVFQGVRATRWDLNFGVFAGRQGAAIMCLLPYVWFILVVALYDRIRHFRSASPVDRLLVCLAVAPLTVFTALSLVRPILPHWPLFGYVPLFPLAGARIAEWAVTWPNATRRGVVAAIAIAIIAAIVVITQARYSFVPLETDPSDEFGCYGPVIEELKARGLSKRPNTFVFAALFYQSAQLEYGLRDEPIRVACYNYGDARGYAFRSRPEDYLGMDGIYVMIGGGGAPPILYEMFFRKVERIAEIPLYRGGRLFDTAKIYLCTEQFDAYPFDCRPWSKSPEAK